MDPEQISYTPIEHSTQLQVQQRQPSPSSLRFADNGGRPQTQSSAADKPLLGNDSSQGHSPARDRSNPYVVYEPVPQAPPATRSRGYNMMRGLWQRTVVSGQAPVSTSNRDCTVPIEEKPGTIATRLQPTIDNAMRERATARVTGYALNIAAVLQILSGALTTGLAASLSGRQVSIAITILGGLSTIVASYLTRARGLNEPEISNTRVKDLDQFLRKCHIFKTDHGHKYGTTEDKLNDELEHLRGQLEEILRNADGERKLSPLVKAAGDKTTERSAPPSSW
ncbi:uncharacterized protein BJ212DRAFT_1476249 [Suillus subaureus]|uniref:SMODS and SLOG-associating 2TM effector domain-containing protein n=1 Tax=Suillus subaureus TaxID=48587 RepID=A0A9P7EIT6_9AGAM|nr:uncharacterized protein BJ212DRAFT_1476249 [Suillus subaureus]KAG1823358.1 hypothetical protein BJ212DRAFT_1476249 [Suillus subaureus]